MSVLIKNLISYPYDETTKTEGGYTFTDNGDGSVTVSGTNTTDGAEEFYFARALELPAGEYVLSTDGGAVDNCRIIYAGSSFLELPLGDETVHVTLEQAETVQVLINVYADVVDNLTLTPYIQEYNTAYRLATIAENEQKVFDAGKDAERDRFWEVFQRGGLEAHYQHAFSNGRFTDETYNPKYPIKTMSNSHTAAQFMFYGSPITDTKVEIVVGTNQQLTSAFSYCRLLHTIRKLTVTSGTIYSNTFRDCAVLKNIVMQGTIGRTIDFSYSTLLTAESMKSIISRLANYAGTSDESKYTITFPTECWERLEADSTAPDGGTWKNYVVYALGWNS